jgi:hypothetical protein
VSGWSSRAWISASWNRVLLAVAAVATVSLAPAPARSDDACAPGSRNSLHGPRAIGCGVQEYLRDYGASTFYLDPAPARDEESEEEEDEPREAEPREAEIDPRLAMERARAISTLTSQIVGQNAGSFNESVADLLAEYHENPAKRDALFALIDQVATGVAPELRARDTDHVLKHMGDGVITAWTVLMSYMILRKLATSPLGLRAGDGLKRLIIKWGRFRTMNVEGVAGLLPEAGATASRTAATARAVQRFSERITGSRWWKSQRLRAKLAKPGYQALGTAVLGGSAGAIGYLVTLIEDHKQDPRAALELIHGKIAYDLAEEAHAFRATVRTELGSLSRERLDGETFALRIRFRQYLVSLKGLYKITLFFVYRPQPILGL